MSNINRLGIKEFREIGFLQEVNRRLLHPLGLALEVVIDADGTERLGGVWDYRDDPAGIVFAQGTIDVGKAARVWDQWDRHAAYRHEQFGSVIQSAGAVDDGRWW